MSDYKFVTREDFDLKIPNDASSAQEWAFRCGELSALALRLLAERDAYREVAKLQAQTVYEFDKDRSGIGDEINLSDIDAEAARILDGK